MVLLRAAALLLLCELSACASTPTTTSSTPRTNQSHRAVKEASPTGDLPAAEGLDLLQWIIADTSARAGSLAPHASPDPRPDPTPDAPPPAHGPTIDDPAATKSSTKSTSPTKPSTKLSTNSPLNPPTKAPQAPAPTLDDTLTKLLDTYANRPVPAPEAQLEAWRAAGLRIVSVPVQAIEAIRAQLPLSGPAREQQLTLNARWTLAAAGPRVRGASIETGTGPFPIIDGSPRLLLRAWSAPGTPSPATTPAIVRIELAPQITTPRAPSLGPASLLEEHQGALLSSLLLDASCTGEDALLITAASPQSQQQQPAQAEDSTKLITPPPAPTTPKGPAAPQLPTLGQAVFSDAATSERANARLILVILPHPPERFRLVR